MTSGNILKDSNGASVNTADLYEKTGLVIIINAEQSKKFYSFKELGINKQYSYRQPFDWEKEKNGELREEYKKKFIEETPSTKENIYLVESKSYQYILKKEDKSSIAQLILTQIEKQYSTPIFKKEKNKKTILFNLKSPIKNFIGRTLVLEKLHKLLTPENAAAITPNLSNLSIKNSVPQVGDLVQNYPSEQLVISGLGGIGKTQLALRYAELYTAHYDNNVLWINAETKQNLFQSFFKLAKKLEFYTKNDYNKEKDLEEITEEVYNYFSDRKSLFILDNVENYRLIEPYLPKSILGNKPTVLITSRYSNWENVAQVLTLNVFTDQEAEAFFKQELNIKGITKDREIKELNKLLQGLPLALQQALAYIKLRKNMDPTFSIGDYIELYKEKSENLLSFSFYNYNNDPYINTVFTVWLVTLDKIKAEPIGKEAIILLNIMAYLDPENISSKIFSYLKCNV